MPYASSLTDKEWEILEPLLPPKKQTRPPVWTKRQILDGIFYQLKNGCNWRSPAFLLPCDGRRVGVFNSKILFGEG
jgi:transposase